MNEKADQQCSETSYVEFDCAQNQSTTRKTIVSCTIDCPTRGRQVRSFIPQERHVIPQSATAPNTVIVETKDMASTLIRRRTTRSPKTAGGRDQCSGKCEICKPHLQDNFQTPGMPIMVHPTNMQTLGFLHNKPFQCFESLRSFALKGHDHSLALELEFLFRLSGVIVHPFFD